MRKEISFLIYFLPFLSLSCNKRDGDDLVETKARLEIGSAAPLSIVRISVEDLNPYKEYEVEYDLGEDIIVRVPARTDARRNTVEVVAPFGAIDRDGEFVPGSVGVRVVRQEDKEEIISEWMTLTVTQGALDDESGNGFPSFFSIIGLQFAALNGLADASQMEIATDREIPVEEILISITRGIQTSQKLAQVLLLAMSGFPTPFGSSNGWNPSFWSFHLGALDQIFMTWNQALAEILGSLPPDLENLGGFYSSLAHDVLIEDVIDYHFVTMSTALILIDAVDRLTREEPRRDSDNSLVGGLMVGALAFTFASEVFSLSMPIGQATSKGSHEFWAVWSEAKPSIFLLEKKASSHFDQMYGDFERDGHELALGIWEVVEFGMRLEEGFHSGYLPVNGIPASGIEGLELQVVSDGGYYSPAVVSHPPISNLFLRMYIVRPWKNDPIEIFDGVTDKNGRIVFPDQEIGGGVDSIIVIDTRGDARAVWPLTF